VPVDFFDHVISTAVVVAPPLLGAANYARLKSAIVIGDRDARLRGFKQTMGAQWLASMLVFTQWIVTRRPWSSLRLGFEATSRFWIGAGIIAAGCLMYGVQIAVARRRPRWWAVLRREARRLSAMVPADDREFKAWVVLSVTAGICEEIVYRGFLIWYVAHATHVWIAASAAAMIFGVAHAYQGPVAVVKTCVYGLVMGGMYVLMGSIWLLMLVHAATDIVAGMVLREAAQSSRDAMPSTGEAP
jgi:hypothetical protein